MAIVVATIAAAATPSLTEEEEMEVIGAEVEVVVMNVVGWWVRRWALREERWVA